MTPRQKRLRGQIVKTLIAMDADPETLGDFIKATKPEGTDAMRTRSRRAYDDDYDDDDGDFDRLCQECAQLPARMQRRLIEFLEGDDVDATDRKPRRFKRAARDSNIGGFNIGGGPGEGVTNPSYDDEVDSGGPFPFPGMPRRGAGEDDKGINYGGSQIVKPRGAFDEMPRRRTGSFDDMFGTRSIDAWKSYGTFPDHGHR